MLKKWLVSLVDQVFDERLGPQPDTRVRVTSEIHGSLFVTIHSLSNGFLISTPPGPHYNSNQTLVFCKDMAEVGEQLIAIHTRDRMGIPGHVNLTSGGAVGSAVLVASNPAQQRSIAADVHQKYTP